ncbi:MAG: sigma factor-like helix-turn-helix DNA-binding protein [Mycobacteriales bacterium]|nr:sigma factor-like helix-turn-helix DNA-binding protein [Mycobacteriales bacterium]
MSQDGDAAAFDAFVQARSPRLLRTAQLLTGDRAAAEKALTQSLGAAWKRWGALQGSGADAVEDEVLRGLVAAGTRATAGAAAPTGRLPEDLGSSDQTRVAARGALRRQLSALPAELRAVVVLRHADGLSTERVARVLGEEPEQVERAEQAAVVLLSRDEDLAPYVVVAS